MKTLFILPVFFYSWISLAQAQTIPPNLPAVPRDQSPVRPLESPEDLIRQQQTPLPTLPETPTQPPIDRPISPETQTFRVKRFVLVGSRVFSQAEIDQLTRDFINVPITFADVLAIRARVTELYTSRGYITTGAYVPEQDFQDGGEVQIAIVEGALEAINIRENRRLNSGYLRSRIANAAQAPLNREKLLEALQLLRLNPLLSNLSATLESGTQPGKSILTVNIQEAPSFDAQINLNNNRVPSVGTFERGIQLSEANLLGLGDRILGSYSNTDGSNVWDIGYTIPLSPQDTALSLGYGSSRSRVIEEPFDVLEIESKSRYYEVSLRQPLYRSPTSELAIGLTFTRRESETSLGFENIGAFPLSPGADDRGRTRLSALRFFQELTQRSDRQVLAFRSQFSLGINAFNATDNPGNVPDSQFFVWRGQAQWVRLIGNSPDSVLLLRADIQLADRSLLSLEQFGIGGVESVRGYRQDALLTDSGLFGSAEVRFPIVRIPNWDSTISLAPFLDFGHGWNRSRDNPEVNTLISGGLGLRWRIGTKFLARFDWGIPFRSLETEKSTLQENGLYFSVLWNPF
jgi:hemolysin activation/secretion protein